MERDMEATHGWTTIVIFLLFLGCIVIASVWKRYLVQFGKVDPKEVDSNPFIKLFNIQSIWSAFGKLRKREHSSMNFLDGLRVLSMTWVVVAHGFMMVLMAMTSNATTLVPMMGVKEGYHYKIQDFYVIFIQYGTYSVDTFFYLSGLLATL